MEGLGGEEPVFLLAFQNKYVFSLGCVIAVNATVRLFKLNWITSFSKEAMGTCTPANFIVGTYTELTYVSASLFP